MLKFAFENLTLWVLHSQEIADIIRAHMGDQISPALK